MKILSWNVNGLRAVVRKGNWDWLLLDQPDIFCLQETKATVEQLPEKVRNPIGYHAYFDSPKEKKGYSGVAIYSKVKPEKVEFIMGLPHLDIEGRLIAAYFKGLSEGDPEIVLINVYFPNGGGGPERLKYKLDFYDEFLKFVEKLRKQGKSVIFCGDINTAHEEIDLARPKENEENTGFLPEERAWIDELINHGYVDIYRHLNPTKTAAYTYWDMKTAARERNVGWRIDYFFVSPDLLPRIKKTEILSHIYGSDHCPISLEIK